MAVSDSDDPRIEMYKIALRKATEALTQANLTTHALLSLRDQSLIYFETIGEIAIMWSYFESQIDRETLRLSGINLRKGTCLTSQIAGVGRKLDAFISVSQLNPLPQDLLKRLNKLAADAISVGERRNRIIHDPWGQNESGVWERIEMTARRSLKIEFIPTTIDQLHKIVKDINSIHEELQELADLIAETHPSSPGNMT